MQQPIDGMFQLVSPSGYFTVDLLSQTVSVFGGLDILVSNAAVNPVFGPTLEVFHQNTAFIKYCLFYPSQVESAQSSEFWQLEQLFLFADLKLSV